MNDSDKQSFLGKSPIPKINAGLNTSITYGNWGLDIFFNGVFGHYIYSNTANAFFTAGALAGGSNVTKGVVTKDAEGFLILNGEHKDNAPDVSSRFLEKGDFIRLQNMTLSYNIGKVSKYISNVKVFLTGQNLLTFTKYSGQDPEVNTDKSIDGVPSLGIDYTAYPRARTMTFGVNVSF